MTRMRSREYLAGGLMTVAGLAVLLEARTLGVGTLARIGPGLYPLLLGSALALVGVLIALSTGQGDDPEAPAAGRPDWRGWSCIIAGICLFIGLGGALGLGPATFACVFVSALGDRRATTAGALVLAGAMTLMALVVFSWLLRFQMPFLRL